MEKTTNSVPPAVLGERISKASFDELAALLDAFLGAKEWIFGITHQPRVDKVAEDFLEGEQTRLSSLCEEIAEEAKLRKPQNESDAHARAHILITWGMHYGERWPQIAAMALGAMLEPDLTELASRRT
jgi:hypothetical protein